MRKRSAISIIVALTVVAGIAIAALLMAMNSSDGGADPTVSEQPGTPQGTDPDDSFPEPRTDEFGESAVATRCNGPTDIRQPVVLGCNGSRRLIPRTADG